MTRTANNVHNLSTIERFAHKVNKTHLGCLIILSGCPRSYRDRYKRIRQSTLLDPFGSIKVLRHRCHVPSSTPVPFSIRRRSRKITPNQTVHIKYCSNDSYNSYISLNPRVASSGQSSPHSSYNSTIFTSRGSSASQSPPSSQHSFTDLSTPSIQISRSLPRILVSSLLADTHTRTYRLEVVQHPLRTAEFGMASLSRLPLSPPIIVQLTVLDPSGNSVIPESELPFLIAHLSLFTDDGLTPLDMGSSTSRNQSQPILYGNLVSSVDQLEDLQGNMGLFFLFPDVSIRWRGRYQLGITLSRISSTDSSGSFTLASQGTVLAEARTRPFDVLALNQYTAAPTTRLTQCFLRQGARMFAYMS